MDLISEGGRVVGRRARVQGEVLELRSRLVVGAGGRGSAVARKAAIARKPLEQGYDVLWFKVDLSGLLGDRETSWREMRPGRMAIAYPSPEGHHQVGVTLARGRASGGCGTGPARGRATPRHARARGRDPRRPRRARGAHAPPRDL
jgi:2-polyprenyl-6-methoxyphenol hydroxylase-like FAD-dependent oxidoreductase